MHARNDLNDPCLPSAAKFAVMHNVPFYSAISAKTHSEGRSRIRINREQLLGVCIAARVRAFPFGKLSATSTRPLHGEQILMKNGSKKRRAWTSDQVRDFESLAKKKVPAGKSPNL